MKIKLVTALLFCSSLAFAQGGGHVGNGGGIVTAPGKDAEPADLHYMPVNFTLPANYQKMDFDQYPGLKDKLNEIGGLIHEHFDFLVSGTENVFPPNPNDLSTSLEDKSLEFYLSPKLNGVDTLSVEQGWSYHQVAFTYSFKETDAEFSAAKVRKIIEVDESLFKGLTPTYQALVIWHEVLHHSSLKSHALISPFIKGIGAILKLRADQAVQMRSATPEEKSSIKHFYAIIQLMAVERNTMFVVSDEGGLYLGPASNAQLAQNVITANSIDASSCIQIFGFPKSIDVTTNTLRSSKVVINLQNYPNYITDLKIKNNSFERSEFTLKKDDAEYYIDLAALTDNQFIDSKIGAVLGLDFKSNRVSHSAFSMLGFNGSHQTSCSKNTIDEVEVGLMNCEGSGNVLSKVGKFKTFKFGSNNRVSSVNSYGYLIGSTLYDHGDLTVENQSVLSNSTFTTVVVNSGNEIKNSHIYVEDFVAATFPEAAKVSISGLNLYDPSLKIWLKDAVGSLNFNPNEKLYSSKEQLFLTTVLKLKNDL